jgi:small subunit ribosomal protein S6
VVFIVNPDTNDEDTNKLIESLQHTVTDQGGTITKSENMGRRQLAYEIERYREGVYFLFEIDGTGREISELERRMRVSDQIMRYVTVRVDEDRRRAEKLRERRARKASKRPFSGNSAGAAATAAPAPQEAATRDYES